MIHADVEDSVGEEVFGKFRRFYLLKCQRGLTQLVEKISLLQSICSILLPVCI